MPLISGGTTGTPISSGISPAVFPDAWPNCAVPLARYARIIGYDSCAFWGVRYDGQEQFQCHTFWTEWQRQMVADALAEAQQMLEDFLGYPLCPTFVTGTLGDDWRFVDEQRAWDNPLTTRWAHIIQPGSRAITDIQANAAIDYSQEPAVIGPFAATFTDPAEVRLYHAGSDRIITPERVQLVGGILTLYVPRCRLVDPDLLETITNGVGLEFADLDSFATAVDVRRVHVDSSVHAHLVREHFCNTLCAAEGCATQTDAACMVVKDAAQGVVRIHPASYSGGTWTQTTAQHCYDYARLNYLAGLRTLPRQAETVIVRLAHSLMPEEPCGCDVTQRLWKRDRHTGDILSREMLNCPWGYSAGALFAYAWATQNAMFRGAVM